MQGPEIVKIVRCHIVIYSILECRGRKRTMRKKIKRRRRERRRG